jgi:hypothetical protein
MPATPPTRRRFQFGLWTMFVATGVVAAWLGLQLAFIRERKAMREWIEANGGVVVMGTDATDLFDPPSRVVTIPAWRRWFGDEPVAYVWATKSNWDLNLVPAQRLFPEALWWDRKALDWVPKK